MSTDLAEKIARHNPRKYNHDAKLAFGRRLEKFALERGWNQSELAAAASRYMPQGKHIGRYSISMYVRGMQMPGLVQLKALAEALKVDPSDLLPMKPVMEPLPTETNTPVSLQDAGNGRAHLRLDRVLPWTTAMQIMSLIGMEDADK